MYRPFLIALLCIGFNKVFGQNHLNVTYAQAGNRSLFLDIYSPTNKVANAPLIIWIHGGAWHGGSKENPPKQLLEKGYFLASIDYRLSTEAPFPAMVHDIKAAVRYLREHAAEYGIDPSRIGVLGDSAGGYMAQMLALTNGDKTFDRGDNLAQSSDVQAAATLYGISNLLNIGEGFPQAIQKVHQSPAVTEALLVHGSAFRDWLGATIDSDPQKALAASPMGHISGKKPPFLIMHGSADTLVSPVQSQQLYRALKKEGNPADYVLLAGAEHGMSVVP